MISLTVFLRGRERRRRRHDLVEETEQEVEVGQVD
jgi:hypothetical protein